MLTQYIMQSIEYTYQLSSWNLKKHLDNNSKVKQDQETHYTSVCTKFEEFILIDEVMNAEEGHFYVSLQLLWRDKIIVTLVYLGKMSPSHRGWIQIVLIWTMILPIVVQ